MVGLSPPCTAFLLAHVQTRLSQEPELGPRDASHRGAGGCGCQSPRVGKGGSRGCQLQEWPSLQKVRVPVDVSPDPD